jgi:superfamily II DNA/RNA helicase
MLFSFILVPFLFYFQSYIVCELHEKLSILLSFLRTHLNTKTMIFVQTCKQVSLEFCTDLQTSQP